MANSGDASDTSTVLQSFLNRISSCFRSFSQCFGGCCGGSDTGKSLSEALFFAEHGENMLCTKNVLNVRNNFCTQHILRWFEPGIFMY